MITKNMKPIGTIGKIKVTENGMIAKVSLDNTLRNKVLINIYTLEDKIFFIDFKRVGILEIIKELEQKNCPLTVEALKLTIKKMDKEIKQIQKTMNNLSKLL
jgi:hypothetical protein